MQRALSASELTAPPVKTNIAANKMSPSAVQQQKTPPKQAENQKKELLKSDTKNVENPVADLAQKKGSSTPGSPQKTKSTAEANKATKGPESEIQTGQAPGSQKVPDRAGQPGPKPVSKDMPKESDSLFGLGSPKTRTDSSKTTESVTGKMFGFGSSIFSSASTLISSAVQEESRTTPPGSRKMSAPAQVSPKLSAMPKISPKSTPPVSPKMSPAKAAKTQKPEQSKKPEEPQRIKQENVPSQPPGMAKSSSNAGEACCPLCKAKLNVGSKDPPNHNTCTECKTIVCNQCGFNPMPMGEVR